MRSGYPLPVASCQLSVVSPATTTGQPTLVPRASDCGPQQGRRPAERPATPASFECNEGKRGRFGRTQPHPTRLRRSLRPRCGHNRRRPSKHHGRITGEPARASHQRRAAERGSRWLGARTRRTQNPRRASQPSIWNVPFFFAFSAFREMFSIHSPQPKEERESVSRCYRVFEAVVR